MPAPSQAKPSHAKRTPKFKTYASKGELKRRPGRLIDSLPETQQQFLRIHLIERNLRYADVVDSFAKKFGRRLSTSALSRWFQGASRPKAANQDEVVINFSLSFTVPKGTVIRFHAGEVAQG